MLFKLRLISISFLSGFLLLLVLCLGAQNLKSRHSLELGMAKSVPLPSGFLIGVSIAIGVISGGTTTALLLPLSKPEISEE